MVNVRSLSFVFVFLFLISFVSANSIQIDIGNNYIPGEEMKFRLTLYDEALEKIGNELNFEIHDFYTNVIYSGVVLSGEEIVYSIPENAYSGLWEVVASYGSIKSEQKFNVGVLDKVNIELEGDNLIITNVGNVAVYSKEISIFIGEYDEVALVNLEIGQIKKIRLTAPTGDYTVKVSDGSEENTFEVQGVSLTGNVVGLESIMGGSFFIKYPMVALFLGALGLVIVIVIVLKVSKKYKN